jgi:hypothetical protein
MELSNNALGLCGKVIASINYHSGHKGAICATYSYRSGNILALLHLKFIALTPRQK